ncbi:MAG: hypothetical protein FJY75_07675 [Candidatus Eisenbacteria bacterium]|uniref:WD40 repeat domain-containing protein n=1 Tax=Eiseniibacteriota bacterium TaxID=2212470 RepID=A0A938BQY9_UNCEI|nr:hypothetical protein [Candidatus Eisenbacteria bacterium]
MRHALASGGPLLGLALLLATAAPGLAAELSLTTLIAGDEDLLQVVPRPDGGLGVLRQAGVGRLAPNGAWLAAETAEPGQTLHLGDDGDLVGVVTHRAGAADFAPTARFELRDARGRLLWSLGETEDVGYSISVRGAVVGKSLNINAPERNALHFYGRGGTLAAEAVVPHLLGGRFSADGGLYFAQSASTGLIAFDAGGAELWRRDGVRLFDATPDGRLTVAVHGERLELLDSGRPVARADLTGLLVRRVAIAPDGARIAVAGREELRVYDGNLRPLWRDSLRDQGLAFTSVDLAAGDGWLLAGLARDLGPRVAVEERHPDGVVRAYDARGALRHEARLAFDAWNIFTPTAILDDTGKTLTITTRRAVYRTTLP